MALIEPNLGDVKSLSPLPEGTYPATIVQVDYKISKGGNPMIVVELGVDHEGMTRKRFAYLVITGAGAFNFESFLRACDFDELADQYKDPTITAKPAFDTDWVVGKAIQVQMVPDTYNGQINDKISGFLKA